MLNRRNALEAKMSCLCWLLQGRHLSSFSDFFTTTTKEGYDMRRVDITPLEQRKLTFDTHALVQDLETHGKKRVPLERMLTVTVNYLVKTVSLL